MDRIYTNSLELPASHEFLHLVSTAISTLLHYADDLDDRASQIDMIQQVVLEICTYIVDRVYADNSDGRIRVELELLRQLLVVEIRDTGQSIQPDSTPLSDPAARLVTRQSQFLASTLMDKFDYYQEADENVWRLTKLFVKSK